MTWQLDLLKSLSPSEQCWLLALAERPSVGPNKTMSLDTLGGKVQAFGKRHGIDVNPRNGLKGLTSREHAWPGGKSAINNDDKSNGLVRLWPLGKALVGYLEANPGKRDELLAAMGSKLAKPPRWSPMGPREGAKITFTTDNPRPATYPAPLRIDAIFTCSCGKKVTSSYDMVWMEDNWQSVEVACPCGLRWRHLKGETHSLTRVTSGA